MHEVYCFVIFGVVFLKLKLYVPWHGFWALVTFLNDLFYSITVTTVYITIYSSTIDINNTVLVMMLHLLSSFTCEGYYLIP